MWLALLVDALLVLEQDLHGLDVLLVDGVEQSILGLHLESFETCLWRKDPSFKTSQVKSSRLVRDPEQRLQRPILWKSLFLWRLHNVAADLVVEEEFDHLEVLVVDAHEEGGAAERVAAVDVQEAAVVLVVQHPSRGKEEGGGYNGAERGGSGQAESTARLEVPIWQTREVQEFYVRTRGCHRTSDKWVTLGLETFCCDRKQKLDSLL